MKDIEVQIELREIVIYKSKIIISEDSYRDWCYRLQNSPERAARYIRHELIDLERDVYAMCDPKITVFDIVK